ncbi:phage tail assembly protein [Neisseriaceae bacterium TC5R-5]|nr:phage tail assembly protein [Neisseriaceae bacterium TC5R-5]
MAVTLKLRKPIEAHGGQMTVLTLRSPTPEDAMVIGEMPYIVMDGGRVRPLNHIAAEYLARITDIPLSAVKQMDLVDFNEAVWDIVNFFWQPTVKESAN